MTDQKGLIETVLQFLLKSKIFSMKKFLLIIKRSQHLWHFLNLFEAYSVPEKQSSHFNRKQKLVAECEFDI